MGEWPASLGTKTDRWISRWTDQHGNNRGQIFGPQRGLWCAINSTREAATDGHATRQTIVSVTGEAVYDQAAGIDKLPDCPRCGRICCDPSTHAPRRQETPDTTTVTTWADEPGETVRSHMSTEYGTPAAVLSDFYHRNRSEQVDEGGGMVRPPRREV